MYQVLLRTVLLLFTIHNLYAQDEHITITGKLLDGKSNEPLPFASIYLKETSVGTSVGTSVRTSVGTSVGTTSNIEGSFVFHIPIDLKNSLVVISMIGYNSIEKSVSDFDHNGTIYLEENILELNEVIVTSEKPLTAKQIIKKAYKSLDVNYPREPYILEGFIRDLQNEDSTYVELLEFATKMLYQPYNVKKEPDIELVELRQSFIAIKHPWNDEWDRKNSIIDLVEDDFIRFDYGPIKGGKGWKYEIESILPFGEKLVYKIKAINRPFGKALFFIDTESFAFIRIEYSRATHNGKYYKRRLTNGLQEASYHIVFEYQEYMGKWYLKYQKEEDSWKIFEGLESKNLLFTKYPKKELFINKIITEKVDEHPFTNNLNQNKSVESQAKPYNPDFWNYYNSPAQTKELSQIEQYLKNAQIKLDK